MAVETKTSLTTDAASFFPDNVVGLITPAILRTFVINQVQSWLDTHTTPASPTAPAGTALMGPSSGAAAVPTFRNPAVSDIQAPAKTILANTTTTTGTASSTVAAFKGMTGEPIAVTDPAFGADPTGATDSTAAFQSAVNSLGSSGGTILVPAGLYKISGTVTINNPMTIRGANWLGVSGANITASALANDVFIINSSRVTIEGLYITRAGAPATGRAIVVGTDVVQLTAVTMAIASTTITSTSASFSAADIGKFVAINGAAGPSQNLNTTITFATNAAPTQAVVAATAAVSVVTTNAQYGFNYLDNFFHNLQLVNHAVGIHIQAAKQTHIKTIYTNTSVGVMMENQLSSDQGTNFIEDGMLFSTDAVNGIGVYHLSGGDLHINHIKFQSGKFGYFLNWNFGASGLVQIADCGFEGQSNTAIFCDPSVAFVRMNICDNNANVTAGPFFKTNNASTQVISGLVAVGNTVVSTTLSAVFEIGNVHQFMLGPNMIDSGGTGTAYQIDASAQNGKIIVGQENVGTVFINNGTNVLVNPANNIVTLGGFTSITLTSLGADQPINIVMPGPISNVPSTTLGRYRIPRIIITGANGDISSATFGIFLSTGSANAIVTAATTFTITTGTVNATNNMQIVVPFNTSIESFNVTPLFFRTQATLTGGTAKLYVETEFIP